MTLPFAWLHGHSIYSVRDGIAKIPELAELAKRFGFPALAITDHGNCSAWVELQAECQKQGIKPIFGVELYVNDNINELLTMVKNKDEGDKANDYREQVKTLNRKRHLVLLAKNQIGLKNIIKITNWGHINGFYGKPQVPLDVIRENREGIIALSACVGGFISYELLNDNVQQALKYAKIFKDCYGDDFYIEIQDIDYKKQKEANGKLLEIAKALDIKVVITNDFHFSDKAHAVSQRLLMKIDSNETVKDEAEVERIEDLYFKSLDDLKASIEQKHPEIGAEGFALARAGVADVLSKMEFPALDKTLKLPHFPNAINELIDRCSARMVELKLIDKPQYVDRFKKEAKVIKEKNFVDYFLVLADIIQYCEENDIGVAPGRGSAAGSLVSYLLGITKLDPIKYDLVFERFINPYRDNWPDIDTDIQSTKREELKNYIIERYGKDYVANVGTKLIGGLKSITQDVARVFNVPIKDTLKLTKVFEANETIGELNEAKYAVNSKIEEMRLKAIDEYFKKYPHILKHVSNLTGSCRTFGIHAGGIIISNQKLTECLPVVRTLKGLASAWSESGEVRELEQAGFIKYDLLGLSAIDIYSDAIRYVKRRHGIQLHLSDLLVEKEEVFTNIFHKLKLAGLFQFVSQTSRDLVERIKPTSLLALSDINTLIRPGCLQANIHNKYVARKSGSEYYTIPEPLKSILGSTYGLILYQEQIQFILSAVTNGQINLGEADIARRLIERRGTSSISEKDAQKLADIKERFFKHSILTQKETDEYWTNCENVGSYLFNKSHSLLYGAIAYAQAYLKHYYPVEFFAAVFNNTDPKENHKGQPMLLREIQAAKAEFGIKVNSVNVNTSSARFGIVGDREIDYASSYLKNIGVEAAREVEKLKPFNDFDDFLNRTENVSIINKRVVESLILAGAMSDFSKNTKALLNYYTAYKSKKKQEVKLDESVQDFSAVEKIDIEREYYGFYFKQHPTQALKDFFLQKRVTGVSLYTDQYNYVYGVIDKVVEKKTKTGKSYYVVHLSDENSAITFKVWDNLLKPNAKHGFKGYEKDVKPGNIVMVKLLKDEFGYSLTSYQNTSLINITENLN